MYYEYTKNDKILQINNFFKNIKLKEIELPIEINEASPLKPDFKRLWKMIVLVIWFIIWSYILLIIISWFLVKSLSIEEEKKLFAWFFETQKKLDLENFSQQFEIPYEIFITDESLANAYALPWAIIYVTQWLLDEIKYEEELIFILWHEMAHIENRDVLKKVSKELPFRFVLASIWLDIWLSWISISNLSWNYSSQITEKQADIWGIDLLNSLKLNLNCAVWFFERSLAPDSAMTQFLSTHPSNQSRIDTIKQSAQFEWECTDFTYEK